VAAHPDDAATREKFARAVVNLLVDYAPAPELREKAEAWLHAVQVEVAAHPDDAATREKFARAVVVVVVRIPALATVPQSWGRHLLEKLFELAQEHVTETILQVALIDAAFLTAAYLRKDDAAASMEIRRRLRQHFKKFPPEANKEAVAMAAFKGGIAGRTMQRSIGRLRTIWWRIRLLY
jgi:hypothetical protein